MAMSGLLCPTRKKLRLELRREKWIVIKMLDYPGSIPGTFAIN